MRNKGLLLGGITAVACAGAIVFTSNFTGTTNVPEYYPRAEQALESADAQLYMYNMYTTGEPDGVIDPAHFASAWEQFQASRASRAGAIGLSWGFEGPDNIGGRLLALMVDKDSANVIWAGGVTGGLWKSGNHGDNWVPVESWNFNANNSQAISCIAQDGNGVIYVGTGSSWMWGTPGFMGMTSNGGGIWYSTDYGVSWNFVTGSNGWSNIDALVTDPNIPNYVWVACGGTTELRILDGGSVVSVPGSWVATSAVRDLVLANDNGRTVAMYNYASGGIRTYVNKDVWGSGTWNQVSGGAPGQLPSSARTRIELGISPTNPNYMYAVASLGNQISSMHMSEDMGDTWFEIEGTVTPSWAPSAPSNQATRDMSITVDPNDPNRVIIGGLDLYEWERNPGAVVNTTTYEIDGQWQQLTYWTGYGPPNASQYVHADQQGLYWGQDGVLFATTDGGVFRSYDRGNSWTHASRGLNITQPYWMDFSKEGWVIMGNQDNWTVAVDHSLTSPFEGYQVRSGDGFACDISHIDSDIWFASTYNGSIGRSDIGANPAIWALAGGGGFGDPYDFLSDYIAGTAPSQCGAPGSGYEFNTLFRLGEWPNDITGMDSIMVVLDTINYNGPGVGSVVNYSSQTANQILTYTEQAGDNFALGDTVVLHDPVQSWAAFDAVGCGVIVTRDALKMSVEPTWLRVATSITNAWVLEWGQASQDLFIGTTNGNVYRVDGLEQIYSWLGDSMMWEMGDENLTTGGLVTSVTKIFDHPQNLMCTGIAIDHNDPGRLAISFGEFTGSSVDHVYESTTADTDPVTSGVGNFTSIQGNLGGSIPVYAIVYDQLNTNNLVIGTEFGIYSTDDGGSTWAPDIGDMGVVPVYDLKVQTYDWSEGAKNPNVIYAGASGRGVWSSNTVMDIDRPWVENADGASFNTNLTIFPNPMDENGTINFELMEKGDVSIQIFDLAGNLVASYTEANMSKGENTFDFSAAALASGTYMVDFRSGDQHDVSKFVVRQETKIIK